MNFFKFLEPSCFTFLTVAMENASASNGVFSGRANQIADPFVVMGFNPITQVLTVM